MRSAHNHLFVNSELAAIQHVQDLLIFVTRAESLAVELLAQDKQQELNVLQETYKGFALMEFAPRLVHNRIFVQFLLVMLR